MSAIADLQCVEFSRTEGWVVVMRLDACLKRNRTRAIQQVRSDRTILFIGTAAECDAYARRAEEALQQSSWGLDPLLLG